MPSNWGLNNAAWRRLRRFVIDRDGGRCTKCGLAGALQVHHIIPRWKRPDLIYDPNNCKTLCFGCHNDEHRKTPGPRAQRLIDLRDDLRRR